MLGLPIVEIPLKKKFSSLKKISGGSIPREYRYFLMKFGRTGLERGGTFRMRGSCPFGEFGEVDQFLGFSTSPDEDIVHQTIETYAGRIPDETIPIAQDANGNLILIVFDGPAKGQVWYWDHEHREIDKPQL